MSENVIMEKAVEYSLRATKSEFHRVRILGQNDAAEYIRKFFDDDIMIYESCFILLMNQQNHVIGYAKISQGGVTGTVVDPKIVCKYAVDSLATGVIFAHNHPSGSRKFSDADLMITRKVKEALKWLDVTLHDSMIITEDGYESMASEGLL